MELRKPIHRKNTLHRGEGPQACASLTISRTSSVLLRSKLLRQIWARLLQLYVPSSRKRRQPGGCPKVVGILGENKGKEDDRVSRQTENVFVLTSTAKWNLIPLAKWNKRPHVPQFLNFKEGVKYMWIFKVHDSLFSPLVRELDIKGSSLRTLSSFFLLYILLNFQPQSRSKSESLFFLPLFLFFTRRSFLCNLKIDSRLTTNQLSIMVSKNLLCSLLSLISLATCAPTHHRKDTNTQVCSSFGCAKGKENGGAVRFTLPFAEVSSSSFIAFVLTGPNPTFPFHSWIFSSASNRRFTFRKPSISWKI